MANKIGSNFLLPAKVFLDKRQELISKVEDLRTWDYDMYPIPIGFEVFVDGKWYTYYGDKVDLDATTGYFRIRGGINVLQTTGTSKNDVMSQDAVTSALNGLNERIQDIVANIGTVLEIKLIPFGFETEKQVPGGLYEKGTSVQPAFAWEVWYNGTKLRSDEITNLVVYRDGVDTGRRPSFIPVDEDRTYGYIWRWTYGIEITDNSVFTISVSYGEGENIIGSVNISQDINYEFIKAKIWGKSKTNLINEVEELAQTSGKKELSKSRSIVLNNINCGEIDNINYESGLYIYYLIPSEIYTGKRVVDSKDGSVSLVDPDDPIRLYVGNMESNSFNIYYESVSGYTVIILEWPQTGILNLEFV